MEENIELELKINEISNKINQFNKEIVFIKKWNKIQLVLIPLIILSSGYFMINADSLTIFNIWGSFFLSSLVMGGVTLDLDIYRRRLNAKIDEYNIEYNYLNANNKNLSKVVDNTKIVENTYVRNNNVCYKDKRNCKKKILKK